MSSFLFFRLLKWHSSNKCNHYSRIYLSMKIIFSTFTFSWWCQVHLWQVQRMRWILFFAFLAINNWKELVRLSKKSQYNAMKIDLSKTSTKTQLSSLGHHTFQKLLHVNVPRHSKTFTPKICIKQKTPLPNPNWKL